MNTTKIKHDESKIFVSSDFHINHDKDFIFKSRGFLSSQEHDSYILSVTEKKPSDSILIYLGDFSLSNSGKTKEQSLEYTKEMMIKIFSKFKKVYYVFGNHSSYCSKVFKMNIRELSHVETFDYLELEINKKFVACFHYPISSPNGESIRGFHLCGHSHLDFPETHPETSSRKMLDCGWDYKKDYWTFSEIRELLSKKGVNSVDHHHDKNTDNG